MLRTYTHQDKAQVVKLFQLNTPQYFGIEEKADLIHYLDHEIDGYFVYELNGAVVGAGGYNITPTDGRLSWYFTHPEHKGKGIGKALVKHALSALQQKSPSKIIVRTSQFADAFFRKFGFVLKKVEKGYWAEGLDLYEMELSS